MKKFIFAHQWALLVTILLLAATAVLLGLRHNVGGALLLVAGVGAAIWLKVVVDGHSDTHTDNP